MFCKHCGKEINDDVMFCPNCGEKQQEDTVTENGCEKCTKCDKTDTGGFWWGLLGFFIPFAGLILYLVWKDEKPKTASAVATGAIIAVGAWFLYYLFIISGLAWTCRMFW